jgi:hypothetical protein
MFKRIVAVVCALVATCTVAVYAADFKEPKDGVYTEKQLTAYIQTMKAHQQTLKAAGKAVDGSSGAGAIAVYTATNAKLKEELAKNGLSEPEYQWIGSKVFEAYGGLTIQDMVDKSKADMAASMKKNQDELKEKQTKLADYEKAAKDGKRVMTRDDREAAMKSAKDDQQSALDEAKQHADEAKAAKEDAEKADAEAKQNDTLAKNPPSDVSADDRPGYIEDKKNAAQSARDAAKEAREKQAEALKAQKEAQAKAAAAAARVKDPEIPTSADDKAQVKQQNDEMIKQLKEEIDNSQQAIKLLSDSQQNGLKELEANVSKIPAQNLALLKKHRAEWEDAMGMKK